MVLRKCDSIRIIRLTWEGRTHFNAEEIKCSPNCQDCSLATASGMFRRERCLMFSKMADTYAHFLLYNFFKTQINVKSVSRWIGPCSHRGQQMPVILFVPKPAILHHSVCSCSFTCCCNEETGRYYTNISDWCISWRTEQKWVVLW